MRDNVDSLAPVESTPRIEPDRARSPRDDHRPSWPGEHSPPPCPPPPPGLVALYPPPAPPEAAPPAEAAASTRTATGVSGQAADAATRGRVAVEEQDAVTGGPDAAVTEGVTEGVTAGVAAAESVTLGPDPGGAGPAEQAPSAAPGRRVIRLEPAHASVREHPSWLGEPTGRFDLDLPEPGGLPPRYATAARQPDPDEVFDQYAIIDDFDEHLPHTSTAVVHGDVYPAGTVAGGALPAGPAIPAEVVRGPHGPALPGQPDPRAAHAAPLELAAAPQPPQPPASTPTEAFTMPVQEVPREPWVDPRLHGGRVRAEPRPAAKRSRPPRAPRRARVAMPLLILFALLAAFFSWVSAEPLWLAVGHGRAGTLTVTSCAGSGLLQRCVGEFATPSRDFTAVSVDVLGPPGQAEGLSAPARMVGENSHRAYVSNGTGGLHLRWIVGLSLVLLCSVAIVFATGALRLPERRQRLAAAGLAFAGPFLITIGFLAATF
ncbi:hypothetical protein ACFQY4_43150 [Catellatospora bangladeshensis]|uniref:Uncharacterized protein n=1 Tax=Catellatospora bangladeshensis TaxID=310355 RepID=A0A8J3JPS8_9ACTN|nr:hypothetical protein [Catellatospora bangladeshensis]GIF82578.1 hypothetical protein Cba03nite_39270 [Catellatospora bangladeshensis]